jgi:hypothetical protein
VIEPDQDYFHFNDGSHLNFKKLCLGNKDPLEKRILELLPCGGFFISELPTLAIHWINGDSAVNFHLMNEESTGGMVVPRGIRSYR